MFLDVILCCFAEGMKEKSHNPFTGLSVPEIAILSFILKELKSGLALRRANNDLNYAYTDTISGKH